jgi:flavorubredoxin
MVRAMDIEVIVPQHGNKYFKGKAMVNKFIEWIDNLQCGLDLFPPDLYSMPKK